MKRSYVLLSLIVSQALCADAQIADFGDFNIVNKPTETPLKPQSVTKNGEDATYGTDWTGGTSYVNILSDQLDFTFSPNADLTIQDGFTFTNKIANPQTQATISITKGKNRTTQDSKLILGQTKGKKITLGSNLNLQIKDFNYVNVVSNLYVGANSIFDVSEVTNVINDGGIVLEGKDSTLKVQNTLTNNGTILMKESSKIESVQNLSIGTNITPQKQGSILVQGSASISSGTSNLTITNQDIKLQNLVSKNGTDSSKTTFSQATLTLSITNNGTLTLGTDASNGVVNIIGELNKTDASLTNDQETNIGNLTLNGFTAINAKNVNLKNINVTSQNATSMTLDSGALGLENTSITLASNSSITASSASTITLAGENAISVGDAGTLTITGTHNFAGNGSLDFVGQTINLGNGSNATLGVSGSSSSPIIGVSAKTINTNSLTLTDLTLQTIGSSTITNTSMTLSGSTIEAIDSEGNLADLNIANSSSGAINIAQNTSVTLRGEGISITEQNITLNNGGAKTTTLTFQAGSNGVTLDGGTSGMTLKGQNSLQNNLLNLNTPFLTLKGKVTFENVVMMSDRDLTIVNTESNNGKGIFISKNTSSNASTIFIGTKGTEGTRFHTLTLTSQGLGENKQAYLKIDAGNSKAVDFRASSFIFQNQEIDLATNTSGTELRLFAYGNGLIDEKFLGMNGSSPTAQLSSSGVFDFNNTTFSDGSSSKVELYAGSGGVTVLPSNLTLKNVSIDAKIIDDNGGNDLNTLDLSSTEGSINILGTSTISASKFVYGDSQGIGADLFVGNETTKGNLTLNGSGGGDNFIIGGEIALDLRGTNGTATSIDIEIQNGTSNKLSDNTLGLTFEGGGLTVIGNGSSSAHIFKAKSFTFAEVKDGDAVVNSPFVKVQKTELTLNMGDSNGTSDTIDLVGTTYLLGDNGTSEAKLKATKGTGNNQANSITLKLHDIEASGKASITENKLSFENSNITVSDSDTTQGLLLKDVSSSLTDGTLAGTIDSITLNNGKLSFQYNSSSNAIITLNADSIITSSGTSTLTLNTIKVGKDTSGNDGLYSLNVTDGTFTLEEAAAGNQLGAITLGSKSSQGGNGGAFEYKNGSSGYNTLTLKGDLTSYGNSSITANTFTISAKDADKKTNYAISSTGGELKLISQNSSALTATADITLDNGSLGYYGSSNTLASLSLDSSSSISSVGDSTLQANSLNVNGASISASGGTLTLKGISSSTTAGNVAIGNAGVLTLQNSNTKLATLKIQDSKSLTLSADVGYITPSNPLGDGVFGQVNVQSLLFESKSGSLISIALNSSSSSSYSDSLFALREGAVTLIGTQDGIKKKLTNASYTDITLSDIVTNTSGLTSITLTPYLEGGRDSKDQNISAKNLLLDLRVSQTNVTQLIESIKDSTAKESMTSIVNSGNNALILESIMQSDGNAFKVGMAEYISNGNVAVVQTALDYINGAMNSLSDSMFASNKIYELIAMLRSANVENRMVRAKNPFMAKTQLASLVKSLVGTAYASSDDSLLLEEESSTPNHGELWASFDGAMSFSQEESGNSSLYGFSAGYDTIVGEKKNFLLGFYASYGYGAYSVDYARNNSHNFGLGFYTRMSFENSEVDLILSQNVGLNHTDIDLGASNSYAAQMLKQTLAYNFYTTDIEARYGYVFKVGSEDSPYYFRPFGGINFALIVNSGARGDGAAELGIEAMNTYQLSVSVGVEMRKYFGEENYLYLLPILQKGLLNDGGGANVGFYGAENIKITPAYNVDTSMAIYLGGQGNIGENLAVNGGVGVKLGFEKKDLLTNWNVGLRYKF